MKQNYGLEKNDIFLTNMRHGLDKHETWSWQT